MVVKEFQCQMCGHRFEVEVVEEREVRERRIPTQPVRCQKCRSTFVEGLRVVRRTRRAS